ncbi:VWA domain-containing protein [Shewanella sp. UCD-KL12]|uniref:vWA domain-containing protein n=1 Tax=Shewanella sp. UCD-KL12 TaxID=1917163 RepID=UPI0009702A9F|nr:VWA domain-containing protein [Shewanella sp. UCD-KL12]
MHFIRPEWFFALLPLALLIIILWRSERQNSTWNRFIAPHLASLLVTKTNEVKRSKLGYLALTWFIAVLALSGLALTKQSLPVFEAAQGRVLVMDMSLSMYATDQSPNRLSQSKFKATDLISELTEGETGLIAYAGDAFTISPLTRDRATLLNLLPTLTPDIMPVRGSNLVAALERSKHLLAQGGHIRGDILLLTDGVSTTQMSEAKAVLKGTQYRLAILAFGSEQGSPIRLADGQLLRDNANQVVVAKTNYNLLSELSQASDGVLVPFQSSGQDLEQLKSWLATTGDTKATELDGEVWQDTGPYIALLLLLPVLLSFRHGLVAALALFVIYIPQPVQASTWDNLWKTQDQQAMQAYRSEDYEKASKTFNSPQWQASAHYKAGQFEEALALFEQDNSATGLYNQANTLMQQGLYEEAIKRYEASLQQAPEFTQAQANLELAKKLAQQQQESSDENQSEQDKSNQDPSSNEDDSDKSDDNSDQDKSADQQDSSNQNKDAGQDQQSQQQGDESNQQQDSNENQSSEPEKSQQDDKDDQPNNDAQMQADPEQQSDKEKQEQAEAQNQGADQQEQQEEQREQQAASQQAESNNDEQNEQPSQATPESAQMSEGPQDLPPEMERALRSLNDDPQVLLRNKMQLEYQKRARQNVNSKDQQQW